MCRVWETQPHLRVCTLLCTSLDFPKLIGVQNGLQDSRGVCLLVEISDDLVSFPPTRRRNVLNGPLNLWPHER